MIKNTVRMLILLVGGICSLNVTAGNFNYSYVDIGLGLIDNDGTDAAGIGGQFSREVGDDFRVKLAYVYSEGLDVDLWVDDLLVTAGYRTRLKHDTDLVVDAGFITQWYANNFVDDSDTGIHLSGLLRHKVDSGLELRGGLSYQSVFDDSDIAVSAGLIFSPDSKTSFGVNVSLATVSTTTAFIRIYMD